MTSLDQLISTFRHLDYVWEKEIPCQMWGGEELLIRLVIDHQVRQPTRAQFKTLSAILAYPTDIRPYFESELFKHYQSRIYGYAEYWDPQERHAYGRDEITPPITNSDEIWSLIHDPSVVIHPRRADDLDETEFNLCFDCDWDEEHGLGASFRDWKIIKFGLAD
jgi:hypothetical protein